jgi:hypothetical protein
MTNVPGSGRELVFQEAVAHWWRSKQANATAIARAQGGTRDHNLRGDTMDGFRDVIISTLIGIGVKSDDIYSAGQLSSLASNLPSYFRATKNWDVVVCKNAHYKRLVNPQLEEPTLIAAVEFKSQDRSIGNNQNNRIEESIGNAHDFWASYENKNFLRLMPRPWLGYLFIGRYEDGDENTSVNISQPLIPIDPIYSKPGPRARIISTKVAGPSYAERYKIFLERMMAKKLYDGACFLVSHEAISNAEPNYRILFPELSGEAFIDSLIRYVKAYYF